MLHSWRVTHLGLLFFLYYFNLSIIKAEVLAELSSGITKFESRVKEDPADYISSTILAQLYSKQARESGELIYLTKAEKLLYKTIKIKADYQTALAQLSSILISLHRFKEAEDISTKILAVEPENINALLNAYDAAFEIGDYKQAKIFLSKLTSLASEEPAVLARSAREAELHGKTDLAISHFQKAIEYLKQNGDSKEDLLWFLVAQGELYFRHGQLENADNLYKQALLLNANNFRALEHLAELRGAQEHYQEAIEIYQSILSKNPRPDLQQALGDLYTYMGKPVDAQDCYEKAKQSYHESIKRGEVHYLHHLATFYSDAVLNTAEALHFAKSDLDIRQSFAAYDQLAWAYFKNGEPTQASRSIKQALDSGIQDPHMFFHAAMIYTAGGDRKTGKEFLQALSKLNPAYNKFHVHR